MKLSEVGDAQPAGPASLPRGIGETLVGAGGEQERARTASVLVVSLLVLVLVGASARDRQEWALLPGGVTVWRGLRGTACAVKARCWGEKANTGQFRGSRRGQPRCSRQALAWACVQCTDGQKSWCPNHRAARQGAGARSAHNGCMKRQRRGAWRQAAVRRKLRRPETQYVEAIGLGVAMLKARNSRI